MDNKELLGYLIGQGSVAYLLAAMIYAYIGAFVMLLLNTTKRDPLSANTPVKFSWSFLFSDNNKRIMATVILIFIFVRFGRDIIGAEVTMYVAFGIGLSCDRLAQFLKDKKILGK